MATERNPFEMISEQVSNVVPLPDMTEDIDATFEVDPTDGMGICQKLWMKSLWEVLPMMS